LGLKHEPLALPKRQFQRNENEGNGQKTFTRLIDLAASQLQGGNYVEARELLLKALEYKTEIQEPIILEWILSWLAMSWEQTEEYQKWTAFFSDFIARNPNHAVAYSLRADSLWYGGKLRESIEDYSRSLQLNPNHISALSARGQVFMECREFSRALEDLELALKSIDTVPGADSVWKATAEAYARNGLAATYAGLGEFNRSLEEFDRSLALCPENAWVYYNRAEAYRSHGDQKNAIEDYKLALTMNEPTLTALKRANAKSMLSALK